MKIAIIDNYDSFTYNLRHLVNELGAEVTVMRNDRYAIGQLEPFDKLIFSPGPGIPSEAGLMPETIKAYAGRKPMLGVCLGHQAIGEAFGARLTNLSEVFHGWPQKERNWATTTSSVRCRAASPWGDTTRGWLAARDCPNASR